MANRSNLSKQFRDKQGRFARVDREEARKAGLKGGYGRKAQRERQRTFAELCKVVDDMPMKSKLLADVLRGLGIDEKTIETMDQKLAKVFALQRKALTGDARAIELWLKLTGEYVENKNINISGAPLSDGVVSFTANDEG